MLVQLISPGLPSPIVVNELVVMPTWRSVSGGRLPMMASTNSGNVCASASWYDPIELESSITNSRSTAVQPSAVPPDPNEPPTSMPLEPPPPVDPLVVSSPAGDDPRSDPPPAAQLTAHATASA